MSLDILPGACNADWRARNEAIFAHNDRVIAERENAAAGRPVGWRPLVEPASHPGTFHARLTATIGTIDAASVADRVSTLGYPLHWKRLRRLMRGDTVNGPTLDEVKGLARVLGVKRAWLAFGEGPRE